MRHGFVKTAACAPCIEVADPHRNADAIIACIDQAVSVKAEVLVLPELCLSGYTCGDLFNQELLTDACAAELSRIARHTKGKRILVFVGTPLRVGGALYNCAAALCDGNVLAFVPKHALPNFGGCTEKGTFVTYEGEVRNVSFCGVQVPFGERILFCSQDDPDLIIAAELGQDLWAPVPPSVAACAAGATVVVELSATEETAGKADLRRALLRVQSEKCVCGYVYADAGKGESTTDSVYSGHQLIYECGDMIAEVLPFEHGSAVAEIDFRRVSFERRRTGMPASQGGDLSVPFSANSAWSQLTRPIHSQPFVPQGAGARQKAEELLRIQAAGLQKRLCHTGARAAVLGVSGGLDSALALLVTVRAFDALKRDRKQIVGVSMPCFGTTDKTRDNSQRLMEALGVTARTVPVSDTVRSHFHDIGHNEDLHNAAYENAQARVRTLVLMDLANDLGGLVVGTGDLSELALGWATYNGDHMSMYGVNASVSKTLVKFLVMNEAERLGGAAGAVLTEILSTEISPELLPPKEGAIVQKTEELIGPYELHDFFLFYAMQRGCSPAKVFFLAKAAFADRYTDNDIKHCLLKFYDRFFSQQFKRSCSPDGVKTGFSLSPRGDWKMPSDASATAWLREAENL